MKHCFGMHIESFSYLTLTGAPPQRGLSLHRQICLNLLLNNSVDLFHCWTIPQRVGECGEQPFILTYILFHLLVTNFVFSCTFFMQKSLSLGFSNLQFFPSILLSHQPPLLQQRSDFWQVCRRNSLLLNPSFLFIQIQV